MAENAGAGVLDRTSDGTPALIGDFDPVTGAMLQPPDHTPPIVSAGFNAMLVLVEAGRQCPAHLAYSVASSLADSFDNARLIDQAAIVLEALQTMPDKTENPQAVAAAINQMRYLPAEFYDRAQIRYAEIISYDTLMHRANWLLTDDPNDVRKAANNRIDQLLPRLDSAIQLIVLFGYEIAKEFQPMAKASVEIDVHRASQGSTATGKIDISIYTLNSAGIYREATRIYRDNGVVSKKDIASEIHDIAVRHGHALSLRGR